MQTSGYGGSLHGVSCQDSRRLGGNGCFGVSLRTRRLQIQIVPDWNTDSTIHYAPSAPVVYERQLESSKLGESRAHACCCNPQNNQGCPTGASEPRLYQRGYQVLDGSIPSEELSQAATVQPVCPCFRLKEDHAHGRFKPEGFITSQIPNRRLRA
ncbi:hypothetical protein M8818_004056 [Zalaria obscura]|uniref:Uncharacterized protein n=1 Tax=Zalaria obscura TaxID=2024903 RepID=A0ACC3SEL0_9PEZI